MRWSVTLFVLAAVATAADARFADTQGFSGKHGVTCETCHVSASPDLDPPATANLRGLPSGWDYGSSYLLTIEVSGGSLRNPVPGQPVGGFDLETDAGAFSDPDPSAGLLRFPSPHEVTYTSVGTLRRSWEVVWTAPDMDRPPAPVHFWLAVLSANGNHVMGGPDAVGERGDKTARLEASLPPADAAVQAWHDQPLASPIFDPLKPGRHLVTGRVPDFADGVSWRLDTAEWHPGIGSPSFLIQLPNLAPGRHRLEAVTVWNDRFSEPSYLELLGGPSPMAAPPSPGAASGLGPPLVLLALFLTQRLVRP